jgi:chromate transport protein ChrA
MSHIPDVDVIDFILLTVYPVAALFVIEMIFRVTKLKNWIKLASQATISICFAIAYLTLITAHWLTSFVLFALSIALLYQARLSKMKPSKSLY